MVLGGKAQELLVGKGVGERKVTVGIRPEHIAFAAAPGTDTVSSKVDVSEMMGSEVYLHVNAVGATWCCASPPPTCPPSTGPASPTARRSTLPSAPTSSTSLTLRPRRT